VVHQVAQADVDGVEHALVGGLEQKVAQRLQGLLASNEVEAGTPEYQTSVTSSEPVGSAATQVTVTVTVTATVLIYNTLLARDLAQQLLVAEGVNEWGVAYQAPSRFVIGSPVIEQLGENHQIYLDVEASGVWVYKITQAAEHQWRQVIKGASVALAQSYLSTRPGIVGVHIEVPFGGSVLPSSESQLVFVLRQEGEG
jgi:hypothetical protein